MADFVVSRRALLVGTATTAILAACSSSSKGASTTTQAAGAAFSLIELFDPNSLLIAGVPQRAPFAVGDKDGVVVDNAPDSLTFTIVDTNGAAGAPITVSRHDKDLPRPYYPLEFTLADPGTYTAKTVIEGTPAEASFILSEPDAVPVPRAGQAMPALETPTTTDGRGVNPICTHDPECPLHAVSLDTALTQGKPIAFIVATPKYCQVAICGPVLDILLAQQAAHPDVTMIHAEVWTDDTTKTAAPAVTALDLTYEPVMFLIGADGTIRQRIDTIFDSTELDAALQSLTA